MSPIIFEPRPLSQVTWHCTLYRRRWSTFEKILGKRIFDPFKGYFKLLPPHFIPSLFLKYSLEYFCPVFERDENRGRRPRKENHFSFFLQICIWGKKYFWAVWRFGAAVSKVSGFFSKRGDGWLVGTGCKKCHTSCLRNRRWSWWPRPTRTRRGSTWSETAEIPPPQNKQCLKIGRRLMVSKRKRERKKRERERQQENALVRLIFYTLKSTSQFILGKYNNSDQHH